MSQPLGLERAHRRVFGGGGQQPSRGGAWLERSRRATSPELLYQWFRWSGQSRQIRAGSYEIQQGASARDLLRMMVQGDESLARVKLIEGWTFQRWREELAKAEGLQPTTRDSTRSRSWPSWGSPGAG